jgi:choline dehydrogenase-like flavoprotein
MDQQLDEVFDAIVIGSGFGGCMTALPLVEAGLRVLMLERGDWVRRGPENWGEQGAFVLTPHYSVESGYSIRRGNGKWRPQGICTNVGGPSVFYGGASFRFREQDFSPPPEISEDRAARWPIDYSTLESYYGQAERLLGIAGEAGRDPTEPWRSEPFPRPSLPLAPTARKIADAAEGLGMRPFRIPMAIDEAGCRSCVTCDAFACAVSAKNDLATRQIPALIDRGMVLRPLSVVTRILIEADRVSGVAAVDAANGSRLTFRAPRVILAAGALASPHLLLASGLERRNPAGRFVGRYLMRHCNAMMYGFFASPPNPENRHHKQVAIHDFYFGDAKRPELGKLGNIQQVMAPPTSLIRAMLPAALRPVATAIVRNMTGLLAIAEDQPREENRVELGSGPADRFGLPPLRIHHRHTARDFAARRALLGRTKQVLRAAGALFTVTWPVNTFSHAVGTVRMGSDPARSPLDDQCRFRGIEGLWVTDGSVFPSSAGVNPSLTIAANALRVGGSIVSKA